MSSRAFKRLLIHRCTFIKQNAVIGQDEYGRDIYGEEEIKDIPCRFDEMKKKIQKNDNAIDVIIQPILYIAAPQEISETIKIKDIRDVNDTSILSGVYEVKELGPKYTRKRLHHYEVELQKERD
ncbi:putative minor capsid protein [Bacillus sp. NPDC077411]|uniref:putative minor capsid protein n=1 Tax=Bacillus sp. NPDC077411 TaxID=3363947 RepID=UPI0037C55528